MMIGEIETKQGGIGRFGVLALLCALAAFVSPKVQAQAQLGDIAEPFELIDLRTGEPVHLEDLQGSVILLDFFSYW